MNIIRDYWRLLKDYSKIIERLGNLTENLEGLLIKKKYIYMIWLDWFYLGLLIEIFIVFLINWWWTYNFYCLNFISPYPKKIISYLSFLLTYISMVIFYSIALDTLFFNKQNIINFFDWYNQLCSDYHLSKAKKIY